MAHTGYIMTLANSIIGVGILAMPFCFQKCGIILSVLLLVLSNLIARISCHYLLKSSLLTRKRSFEFLALYAFGPSGKLMVELCIIGYLLGTCVTYFVVIGDLGPQIVAKIFNIMATESLRTWIMVVVTFLCIIPLGLLKNVDSLSAVCTASVGFYFCLVVKVMFEARAHLLNGDWTEQVDYWKPSGVLQCLPIFSMALACQMQLFEVIESVNGATLEKLNEIVRVSTGICTCVYIFVGLFGYIAFCTQPFSGNILMNFSASFASDAIKMGFVLSVAFSFPLAIFPCRASIYSLLYRRGHSDSTGYMPEIRFKWITVAIVFLSLVAGILIPSIELVIGLVGSTIGVAICVMFPASCFMKVFKKDSTEKLLAQFILVGGFCLMILGTYANLDAIDDKRYNVAVVEELKVTPIPEVLRNDRIESIDNFKETLKTELPPVKAKDDKPIVKEIVIPERIDPMPKAPKEDTPVLEAKEALNDEKGVRIDKPKINSKIKVPKKEEVKDIDLKDDDTKQPVIAKTNNAKDINNEINKDAIKKDEEVAAEEEKKKENIEEIKQAKDELKQTKELLEKKVIELQQELAKQNLETQQLVEEKLGVIADKVGEIERKVNLETEDKQEVEKKDENNEDKPENELVQEKAKSEDYQKTKNDLANIVDEAKPGDNIKADMNSVKNDEKLPEKSPILMLLTDKLQKPALDSNRELKHQQVNNTVYEPMSYKVGEVMHQESLAASEERNKKPAPIPLPLFINSTLLKSEAKRKTDLKKIDSQENKDNRKDEEAPESPLKKSDQQIPDETKHVDDKTKDQDKAVERENIESIRRDILEVVPNRDDTTQTVHQSPDNVRLKRQVDSKEFCVNWDIEKQSCRDVNVNNELLLQGNPLLAESEGKAQPFGRDLKSLKEDTD